MAAARERQRSTMCPYSYTAKRYTYSYTICKVGKRLLTRVAAMPKRMMASPGHVRGAVYVYEYGYEYGEDSVAEQARCSPTGATERFGWK